MLSAPTESATVTGRTVAAGATGRGRSAKAGLRRTPTSATQNARKTTTALGNTDVSTANAILKRKGIAKIANTRSRDLSAAAVEQAKMTRS